jgi:hypothetical protein
MILMIIMEVKLVFRSVYHFTVFFGQNKDSYIPPMDILSEHIPKPANVAARYCSTIGLLIKVFLTHSTLETE